MRRSRSRLLPALALLAAGACSLPADTVRYADVSIQNSEPRRDESGEVIDAHDGCLQFFQGRYYLYGTAYGRSAGFGINNRFRAYSSADLMHWRFEGELLASPPVGVFYRPYVAYNPATRNYVLWFNWYPKLWDGLVGVAVSPSPAGPFTIVERNARLSQAADRPGDGSLFVDTDGRGYFIYTTIGQDHAIRVERLSPDFLRSTGETSAVLARGCEAPAMFRRGDLYYVLFDSTCCFGPEGSGARVYTARSPLGPYELRGNINRDAKGRPVIPAQQTFVARIPGPVGDMLIWMGDLWGSRHDGVKGHDLQFWSRPLLFTGEGDILPMEDARQWRAKALLGGGGKENASPYVFPKRRDAHPLLVNPCTHLPIPPEEEDTGGGP